MGYDVTNNTSTIELVPSPEIPVGTDLTPIELPDITPSPELVGTDAISPVGEIVELPDTLPSPELIAATNVTPTGEVIEIPPYIPPTGVVLLEAIPIPDFLSGGSGGSVTGVTRLENLEDVNTSGRADQYILVYDLATNTYIHEPKPTGGDVFPSDIVVNLSGGKTFGKYEHGDTIPSTGLTAVEVITNAAIEYINAEFTAFGVSQATTVEVGTTLSGTRTFTWGIDQNSGSVPSIHIWDETDSSYIIMSTPNDGGEVVTITTYQLNSEGGIQQWRGVGTDVTPVPDVVFYSNFITITARYYRFYGPVVASPVDSITVRALPSSAFQVGTDVFNLNTGITLTKFVVALPPGVTISSVIDLDALNADITSEYIFTGTINVLDAGGTNRAYNIYEMNVGTPYSSDHRHQITAG